MKTPEQLKGALRNFAKNNNLKSQEVLENTSKNRGSSEYMRDWLVICDEIRNEPALDRLWVNYQKENFYASDLTFKEVSNTLLEVAQYLYSNDSL